MLLSLSKSPSTPCPHLVLPQLQCRQLHSKTRQNLLLLLLLLQAAALAHAQDLRRSHWAGCGHLSHLDPVDIYQNLQGSPSRHFKSNQTKVQRSLDAHAGALHCSLLPPGPSWLTTNDYHL